MLYACVDWEGEGVGFVDVVLVVVGVGLGVGLGVGFGVPPLVVVGGTELRIDPGVGMYPAGPLYE